MKHTTIKDIASVLKLSVSTVSRALSNHPDINQNTKAIVNKTAREMGYRPNVLARSLKSSQSNHIGVIVPEIRHDFFANAISGIEEVAYQKGYTVIIAQSNEDSERERLNLVSMHLNRVAGIIVSISQTTRTPEHFKHLISTGVKMVFFDRVFDDPEMYKVVVDDFEGSYNAVKYLAGKGYKNIIHFAGPQNLSVCKSRRNGYLKAMEDSRLDSFSKAFEGGMHENDGYTTMDDLLSKGNIPEAIFAVNDPVAIGAFKRLKEGGIKIPQEVAIIGFSNNPITEVVDPPLTTVEQPSYQLGKEAAKLLFEQIEGVENSRGGRIVELKTRLIIRESA